MITLYCMCPAYVSSKQFAQHSCPRDDRSGKKKRVWKHAECWDRLISQYKFRRRHVLHISNPRYFKGHYRRGIQRRPLPFRLRGTLCMFSVASLLILPFSIKCSPNMDWMPEPSTWTGYMDGNSYSKHWARLAKVRCILGKVKRLYSFSCL